MSIANACPKCKRSTFQCLDEKGKWITLDSITGSSHWLICHPEPPQFKIYDQIIVFWPKSVKTYVVSMIKEDSLEYWLTEHLTAEHKVVTFNKVEQNAKLMDPIYELLYL